MLLIILSVRRFVDPVFDIALNALRLYRTSLLALPRNRRVSPLATDRQAKHHRERCLGDGWWP